MYCSGFVKGRVRKRKERERTHTHIHQSMCVLFARAAAHTIPAHTLTNIYIYRRDDENDRQTKKHGPFL